MQHMQRPLTLPCLRSMTLQFTAHYSSVNEGLSVLRNCISPMRWSRHLQQENRLPDLYPRRRYEPCCYRKATSATSSSSSWCAPGRRLFRRPAGWYWAAHKRRAHASSWARRGTVGLGQGSFSVGLCTYTLESSLTDKDSQLSPYHGCLHWAP